MIVCKKTSTSQSKVSVPYSPFNPRHFYYDVKLDLLCSPISIHTMSHYFSINNYGSTILKILFLIPELTTFNIDIVHIHRYKDYVLVSHTYFQHCA